MTDFEIECLLANSDERVLESIQASYGNLLNKVVFEIAGTQLDCQERSEIENMVLEKVWTHRLTYKAERGAFATYISAIARNTTLNYLRENQKHIHHELQEDIVEDTQDAYQSLELQQALGTALGKLKPVEREIFLEFYYYNRPYSEIAAGLHLGQVTARSIMRRTKAKLKKYLKEEGYDYESDS